MTKQIRFHISASVTDLERVLTIIKRVSTVLGWSIQYGPKIQPRSTRGESKIYDLKFGLTKDD
jgi:hypothetical protein